ncbi:hypothetical protein FSP39_023621 [Pinctada imbricata]|uniref:Uncharacterized protein n=1 Tax=Pinctada imbricata TaxID=66713 RepID=A0AA89BWG1_PINIB|nr:hypothetical protein FSP39_023621 [Pinctada imbricata]
MTRCYDGDVTVAMTRCYDGDDTMDDDRKPKPNTPLLHGDTSGKTTGYYSAESETKSARKYKPSEDIKKEFLSSVDMLSNADMKRLPIPALDKTFQDQGKVFDDLFKQFQSLKVNLNNFKGYFSEELSGIPEMTKCVELLVQRCGEAKLDVQRRKYSVEVTYDQKEIMRNSSANPQQVLEILDRFNALNRNIQKILERAPEVERSATILLNDEDNMRKEVTKSDLPADQGTEAMRSCMDNIHTLRKINSHLKTITKHTNVYFKEVMEASKAFFKEETE